MSEVVAVLLLGVAVGMFNVFEKRKTTHSEPCRYKSSSSRKPECEVVLPGGLHFCYARGQLEKYGWCLDGADDHTVEWYTQAARRGQADAQLKLGLYYAAGNGVPRDYVRAYGWLNLAAAAGDSRAGNFRDDLSRSMTREQIAEAQRLSYEWHTRHTVARGV